MTAKWYVVQTQFKQETIAEVNLVRQGFEVFLPQYVKKDKKGNLLLLPLFSGYLFVQFDKNAVRWQSIASTMGVSKILGYSESGSLTACRDGVIPHLQSFCDSEGIIDMMLAFPTQSPLKRVFKTGERVEILKGLFKGEMATYWNETKNGASIILSLLNSSVRVILKRDEITPE